MNFQHKQQLLRILHKGGNKTHTSLFDSSIQKKNIIFFLKDFVLQVFVANTI